MKTPSQIVSDTNDLARTFYAMRGYDVPLSYKFYGATHPHEVLAWEQAVLAQDVLNGTDVENAMQELDL